MYNLLIGGKKVKNELDSKRIRNIYIMLIAILCMTIISTTAILSYVAVHWNDKMSNKKEINTNTEYDVSSFTEIRYDEFLEKYKGSEQSLIYIGRSTCIHCINFVPVLKEAQNKYGYKTYYLDISKIKEDEYKEIMKLNNFFDENFGMTPMVVIVKDGNIIDNGSFLGEADIDTFSKFLEKVGYSKKN